MQEELNTVQRSFNKILSLLALCFASVMALAILIWAIRVSLKRPAPHQMNMISPVPVPVPATESTDGLVVFSNTHEHDVISCNKVAFDFFRANCSVVKSEEIVLDIHFVKII